MWVRNTQQHKRALIAVVVTVILVAALLHPTPRSYISDRVPSIPNWRPSSPAMTITAAAPLDLPPDYDFPETESTFCADRFSKKYLEDLRGHAVSYCEPGARSNLTCFHSHTASDEARDSFCIGRGTLLDLEKAKFTLDCPLRTLSSNETDRGLIALSAIRGYWYGTGPANIMAKAIDFGPRAQKATANAVEAATPASVEVEPSDKRQDEQGEHRPPRFYLLLQREGESNPWHCLLEIWSAWMSFDVLRMSRDPLRNGEPYFRSPEDVSDTQVVILDERGDGPYWELWTLFAQRKPVRLKELLANPTQVVSEADIIIPLAGASNPLWQNDWVVRDCQTALTLKTFSRRVLGFYGIEDPAPRAPDANIVITFVDRRSHRRLLEQEALFAALQAQVPHVTVNFVDFGAIPFGEQLRVARNTDILVGVHGAGLTHTLFMRESVGAVVEIQPVELGAHSGFRNIAAMLDLDYFRVHAQSISKPPDDAAGKSVRMKRADEAMLSVDVGVDHHLAKRDWHWSDVRIEQDRFLEVMDVAIKSLYAKGSWNYDVN